MTPLLRRLSYCAALTQLVTATHAAPAEAWPYWPEYLQTPLTQIHPQEWKMEDHIIDGWDWSLPLGTKPAPNGLLAVYRISDIKRPLDQEIKPLDLPLNETLEIWVKWRDLEPTEGQYRFDLLQARITEASERGCSVILRMLCSATSFAPEWMASYKVPIAPENGKKKAKVTNYDISNPEFHKRYLLLVNKLGESGIPKMGALKGAYVGYASPSFGDEGIGPHGVDPDTVPHVVERLDAWAEAFDKVESKVFMGGSSQHGYQKGFGTRRGFVEMFLYHIPDEEIGQIVDKQGYLTVDESVELLKSRAFHGEENEEYDKAWATEARGFRFGPNTDSYPYRYFISNLRTLQMRCNYVLLNSFSIFPEQTIWLGQSLGRTVEDSPDIWCALRESYVKNTGAVKNMDRWLYQRDTPGFETTPIVKINHPIKMWMVETDKNFDYMARKGKKIGLAVDDRWSNGNPVNVAIKTTYFDKGVGTVDLVVQTASGSVTRKIQMTGSDQLKTATHLVPQATFTAKHLDYDIIYQSSDTEAVLSFVRIIRTAP
jgi:Beta-galactosidase